MNALSRIVGGCLALLLVAAPVAAEVPPLKEDELRAEAELIVTGVVQSIKTKDVSPRRGDTDAHYTITVTVKSTEKGEVAEDAKSVVVHGWNVKKRARLEPGASGHYSSTGFRRLSALKEGTEVRMFLERRKEGGYDIVFPNGFSILEKAERQE